MSEQQMVVMVVVNEMQPHTGANTYIRSLSPKLPRLIDISRSSALDGMIV